MRFWATHFFLEPKTVYLKALLYYIGDCWIYRVKSTSRGLAHLSSYNLAFVPDWPDFNTSSPFDVSSQQQGEDIYVQIKTHINAIWTKRLRIKTLYLTPGKIHIFFSTYFCLVFTICKVQTNNSNENAKNVTHVYKYVQLNTRKTKNSTYCSNSLSNIFFSTTHNFSRYFTLKIES